MSTEPANGFPSPAKNLESRLDRKRIQDIKLVSVIDSIFWESAFFLNLDDK